jgi:DUF4097 and DUF4098 domain-containing protein YvlB
MTSDARPVAIDHPIGPNGQLTVKVATRDIRLVPSPDDHVRVRSTDGRPLGDDITIEAGDGSLSIRETGRFLGMDLFFDTDRSVGIVLEVPPAAETNVQTASGDISANGLRGEQLYRSASGAVSLEDALGRITTETVSGDVGIGAGGVVELIVKTVSGDVTIDGEKIERVRLTTTSGDIRLVSGLGAGPHAIETLSGDALIATNSGIRIQARTISGDLRSDLPHTADGMIGRRSLTVGDGAVELSFRSVSGDLRVVDPATTRAPAVRTPASPPLSPEPPGPRSPSAFGANDDRRLEILKALERGEIDIATAGDELALLDETDG